MLTNNEYYHLQFKVEKAIQDRIPVKEITEFFEEACEESCGRNCCETNETIMLNNNEYYYLEIDIEKAIQNKRPIKEIIAIFEEAYGLKNFNIHLLKRKINELESLVQD